MINPVAEKKRVRDMNYDELLLQIRERPFWAANKLLELDTKLTKLQAAIAECIQSAETPLNMEHYDDD